MRKKKTSANETENMLLVCLCIDPPVCYHARAHIHTCTPQPANSCASVKVYVWVNHGRDWNITETLRAETLDGGLCCWLDEVRGKVVSSFTLCCAESGRWGGALALEARPCFSLHCLLRACLRGQVLISAWMRWDSPGRLCDGWMRRNGGISGGV